ERQRRTQPDEAPVLQERARAPLAVTVVLARQPGEAVARGVVALDLAALVDAAPRLHDALGDLGVLRDAGLLVDAADAVEDLTAEGARKDRVDPALGGCVADRGASEAERARQRGSDRPLDPSLRAAARGAAHVVGAGALEHVHALLEVVGSVVGVH